METPEGLTERTVTLAGGECSLAEAGAGGRPILLVHGFSGAKEDFTPYLSRLADAGWHAVAYDNFGHGASHKPESYTLLGYRDQLFDVMSALGWDTCVALGHSMGGMILEEAIAAQPERFEAVVLMDTSHGPIALASGYRQIVESILASGGVPALLGAANAMAASQMAPSTKALYDSDPDYQAFGDRKFLATAEGVFLAMFDELGQRPDRLDALKTLTVPALVIVGAEDQPFLQESEEMAAAIPQGRLALIEAAAHSPQFEAPAAWWAALSGFLAGLSGASA
ncbi:MAG TPA: alpha/beta hydrolase [Acidimicrobiales bacterium]|jgi:pimeloyl-ACP methyl ester carboxylesterase|nr:alpha/beta hydrolase [Acidimicrobiales bacterium]